MIKKKITKPLHMNLSCSLNDKRTDEMGYIILDAHQVMEFSTRNQPYI